MWQYHYYSSTTLIFFSCVSYLARGNLFLSFFFSPAFCSFSFFLYIGKRKKKANSICDAQNAVHIFQYYEIYTLLGLSMHTRAATYLSWNIYVFIDVERGWVGGELVLVALHGRKLAAITTNRLESLPLWFAWSIPLYSQAPAAYIVQRTVSELPLDFFFLLLLLRDGGRGGGLWFVKFESGLLFVCFLLACTLLTFPPLARFDWSPHVDAFL